MKTRVIIVICCIFVVSALVAPAAGSTYGPNWTIPDEWEGGLWIGSNPLTNSFLGKITVECDSDASYVASFYVNSPFSDGSLKWNGLKFSVETTYRESGSGSLARNTSRMKVQMKEGIYNLTLFGTAGIPYPNGPYESVIGNWFTNPPSYPGPLYGMHKVLQKGDSYPYGYGGICRWVACCAYSLYAIASYFGCNPYVDKHAFVDDLKAHRGINKDNYLSMPIAAKLLRLKLIGSVDLNDENLAKYHGRNYGLAVKVHRPTAEDDQFHWVASTDGVFLKPSPWWGMMDPQDQYEWFKTANFKPVEMRVLATLPHWLTTQPGWWKNTWAEIVVNSLPGVVPYSTGSIATLDNSATTNIKAVVQKTATVSSYSTADKDVMLLLSCLTIESSSGAFIDRVISPNFGLEKTSSFDPGQKRSLVDVASESIENDETPGNELVPTEPDLTPNHSIFNCNSAPAGDYRLEMSGTPNTNFSITVLDEDSFGGFTTDEISGLLDCLGKATITISRDPGTICAKLADAKELQTGAKVAFSFQMVTDISDNEFFCEEEDRTCGVRVVVSNQSQLPHLTPGTATRAKVVGNMVATSPEIVIAAESVESYAGGNSIQSLGMSTGKWPEMANCLLARLWGKVTSIDGTTAVIDNGSGPVTVTELDISVAVGDYLSLTAVLRANREVKVVAGTAKIENK